MSKQYAVNQRVDILDTAFLRTWMVDKIQARSKFISYWERACRLDFWIKPATVSPDFWRV